MVEELDRGRRGSNELVLPEGEFMYTRDTTSGITFVRRGPVAVTAQAQDEPVVYDPSTERFRVVSLAEAAQVNKIVPTGHYAVLYNPAVDSSHPDEKKEPAKELRLGQRIHLPGPVSFALWPRQISKIIPGHQLRSNQYLVVRVYDEQAAYDNWTRAVVKKAAPAAGSTDSGDTEAPAATALIADSGVPDDLSVGRLLIIRGTEVSFYIPPSGIEVVPNDNGEYVREAITLERLQYTILIDENGKKRYVRGPDVVFPLPTERFHVNADGEMRFRPIELNGPIQGLHIKVIADYIDEAGAHGPKGKAYQEGDELFLTGETTPLYFPCEQHSAIKYDGHTKHFATAIPAGDGRYVLHRHTGQIRTLPGGEKGTMCLPDPREEVFARRALTEAECATMYPGNAEVLEYNKALRSIQVKAPTTRKGVVTEGEVMRNLARVSKRGLMPQSPMIESSMMLGDTAFGDASYAASNATAEMGGDEFTRAASYTEPRTITIGNDRFGGVPKINIWTGYAVMVVDTSGKRRVEVGPKRILLNFDETLETLALSSGKPKTTDHLLQTAYLKLKNNKVADILQAVTADHVNVEMKLAFRVNFEGDDPTRWFAEANYVKLLSDHARSILKAKIRQMKIEDFYSRSEDFIRDTILGAKPTDGSERQGMWFEENAMRVYDVEVFRVDIGDNAIQALLNQQQHEAVKTGVELESERRKLIALGEHELIQRKEAIERAETIRHKAAIEEQLSLVRHTLALRQIQHGIEQAIETLEQQKANDAINTAAHQATVAREEHALTTKLNLDSAREKLNAFVLEAETRATVERFTAAQGQFSEALLALGNQDVLVKVAEALSVQAVMGGKNFTEVVEKLFAGSPLAGISELMQKRAALSAPNGNGSTSKRSTDTV